MFSQLFSRSTAICRNDFGYRPTLRFFATRSPFPCKVCQLRVSHFEGSVQSVTIGGITVNVSSWADDTIVVTLPDTVNSQVPLCPLQQQQQYGGPGTTGVTQARC